MPDLLRNLLGSDRVLLKLGLDRRLRDALLQGRQTSALPTKFSTLPFPLGSEAVNPSPWANRIRFQTPKIPLGTQSVLED